MNEFFQMLKKDHEEVKGILKQLKETKEKESSKREDLFQKLRGEKRPGRVSWEPILPSFLFEA